jgi:hypothetical protein
MLTACGVERRLCQEPKVTMSLEAGQEVGGCNGGGTEWLSWLELEL